MNFFLKYFIVVFTICCFLNNASAQTTNISGVINNYVSVTSVGSQSINVPNVTGFVVGDKVLLIQMKGASIDTTNTSNFGTITSYNEAGNYEMLVISTITSTTITFTTPILRTYDVLGLVQLVKVPVYNNVNVTGSLTCLPWNGSIGGILALEVNGCFNLNANIDVSGKGFLGGVKVAGQWISCAGNLTDFKLPASSLFSAYKGEGVVLVKTSYSKGMGALGNGGGGGNDLNGGGGGGANFGTGGHGGHTTCNALPVTLCGGWEGLNCMYSNSNNKIFLGGGGGAGHENDGVGTGGVSGGGIVLLRCSNIFGNGNSIISNGSDNLIVGGNDGQGGGGAGGTILLDVNSVSLLNVSVKGGNGGTDNFAGPDCHGKGGGGGGGIIWTSSSIIYTSILMGGNPGINTGIGSQCPNSSNGATIGQVGGTLTGLLIPGASPLTSVVSFSLTTSSNCVSNNSSTATASVSTSVISPVFSYTWANSGGTIISQTSNVSSLTNSLPNLANGVYMVTVQMNAPCGPIMSQTIAVNCVVSPTVLCLGTLIGTGMGVCNTYSFTITPSQTITPLNYGSQGYACNSTTQPDVSFNIMGSSWRVNKFNWNFTATTNGFVSGYTNLGAFQSFPFSATNTITPLSYSGTFIQFAINGVATGALLSESDFSISLSPIVFGSNSYTYCASTATSIAISPTIPASGGPWTYNWQPGGLSGSTVNVSPLVSTVYTVTANSSVGCPSTSTVAVNINCTTTSASCGGSLEFNNISDAVSLPLNNQIHSSNGFTWECWFKLNAPFASNPRALINSVDAVSYEDIFLGFGWNYGAGNVPTNHLGFKVDGPNATTGPANVSCEYMPPGGFLLGTWYHAAGVMNYATHTSKLYVNGLLVDTKIENADPFSRTIQSQLSYDPGLALGGNMDEVRIWKRVRTDAEILADYNHCLAGNEVDLLSYYRCNQSSGSIVTDATSNGNNGTFVNSTSWSVQQPTLTGSSCSSLGNFSISITSTCISNNNAAAVAVITTTITLPVVSYSWTNSVGTIISQTNNTTSLMNAVSNLSNGIYTLISQINAPCGPINTQTININCIPPPLCSGNLGAPIFFEDFGSGTALYGPALAPGVTNYPYLQGVPNNGTYVIANSSNPSGTNAGYVNDGDHTGNSGGYMMVVNSDYAATEVYRRHVTGLCPGTTYVFSAYLANNNSPDAVTNVCGSGYVYANIKFQTEFPVGTVLNSITSGNLAVASNSVTLPWIQYGFAFTTGPGQTSVDVVLINNAPGGCGNDYAVDDISVAPCGPGVALVIVPNQTVFCIGSPVSLQSNFTSGTYTTPQYQWQFSNDGGVTWANVSGATSPNYNISSVTATQAGMYQLLISESGNINLPSCRINAGPLTFSVSSGSVSTASLITICPNITTTLTATGATSYTWSTGVVSNSITVNPSTTTTYTVLGASGTCTSQAVSTVSVVPSSILAVMGNTLICSGQSTALTANGGSSFNWNPSNTLNSSTGNVVIATPTITTTYIVTDASTLCSSPGIITVSVIPTPTLILSPNTSVCLGSSANATLTANGAINYSWVNASSLSSPTGSMVIASPNTTTNYTVTGLNSICSNSAVVTVSVNPSPTITASSFSNTSCGLTNGSVTITSLPSNNTYSWSAGVTSTTNTASALAPGNYTITVLNGSCQTNTLITISSSIPLTIVSSTVIPSHCILNDGSIFVITSFPGSNYSWSPNISTTNTASGLAMGNYALTIINGACTTSTVFNVESIGNAIAIITTDVPNCDSNDGVFTIDSITGGTPPYLTSFNNTGYTGNTVFENLSAGSYTLNVIDSNVCKTEIVLIMPESNNDYTLYIPNTFTPNNNSVNDIWYVKGTCINQFNCLIYNRWGEKIAVLNDLKDGWDGTFKGVQVPEGVYVYLIEVETQNGTINKAGHITVFR
jgi:gliding motility-associated-like protein